MNKDRSQIDQIKEASDIVTVIGRYMNLKNTGQNFSGLCPFHNEKTPSFIVSPKLQRYKCFGCGKSGDVINFVEEIENLEFLEAVEKLAKEAGIQFSRQEKISPYIKLEELNEIAAKYFYKKLGEKDGKQAVEYLRSRNFTGESAKRFMIGYAPGDGSLLSYVRSLAKFGNKDLLDSGLFVNKNGVIKEKFVKRIMFAISTNGGKTVGFSGRLLPGNDFGPKYLNTPETPIFKKRDLLYGLAHTKNFIRKEDLAILVEGQPDVVKAYQYEIKNIAAPLGTSLTENQAKVLKQYTENILLIFDSDSAGQKAIERAFEIFIPLDMNLYVFNPSPYKDLDELIDDKKENSMRLLLNKQECFEYILKSNLESVDLTTIEGKREIEKLFNRLSESIISDTFRSYAIETYERLTGLKANISPAKANINIDRFSPQDSTQIKKRDKEVYLLGLIIKYGKIPEIEIDPEIIRNPNVKNVIIHFLGSKSARVEEVLLSEVSQESRALLERIELNIDKIYVDKDYETDIRNLYNTLLSNYNKGQLLYLRKELSIYEDDEEKSHEITLKIQEITEELNRLNRL